MIRRLPLAGLLLLAGCAALHSSEIPGSIELLPVQEGWASLGSDDLEGQVLVLSFFTPYCFGCQRALAQVDSVYRRFGGHDDVEVLLVVGDVLHGPRLDPRYMTQTYLSSYNIVAPAYWDNRGRLSQRFDARQWHRRFDPRMRRGRRYVEPVYTVVLDREGTIVKRQSGAAATVDRLLDAVVEARSRGAG